MSDLADRLRADPALYAYIAADRIEELEKEVRDQDYQINELTSTIEDLTIACQ